MPKACPSSGRSTTIFVLMTWVVAAMYRSNSSPGKDNVLFELEANPRKKQRVWREVGEKSSTSLQELNNPPKPTDEVIPGPIPQEFLKSWGILCDVSPEELTDEALLAEKTTEVPNDRTSN